MLQVDEDGSGVLELEETMRLMEAWMDTHLRCLHSHICSDDYLICMLPLVLLLTHMCFRFALLHFTSLNLTSSHFTSLHYTTLHLTVWLTTGDGR